MSPTVSNGPNSNNADYVPATATIGGEEYQKMIPCDATGAPIVPVTTQDVNLTQVGGVATSLGQKAEASSIPVVLATEQDTVISVGALQGNATKICTWDGFNEVWTAFPNENGTPVFAVARDNGGSLTLLLAANATPGASDLGLVTRNIPSGTQEIAPVIPTTGSTPTAIALNTATLTLVLAANASRKYAYVYNPGIYEIGLRLSTNTTSPTINSIRIPAQTSWSSDLYEWQGPIYAISYTTSFSCHVSEQT